MCGLTIHSLEGPASSLVHYPMSASNIIYNTSSSWLANIFLFVLSLLGFQSMRSFHTLVRNSFPSSTDVRSHNPPPWGPTSSLAYRPMSGSDTICNSPSPPIANIVIFGLSLLDFRSRFIMSFLYWTSSQSLKWVCYGEIFTLPPQPS